MVSSFHSSSRPRTVKSQRDRLKSKTWLPAYFPTFSNSGASLSSDVAPHHESVNPRPRFLASLTNITQPRRRHKHHTSGDLGATMTTHYIGLYTEHHPYDKVVTTLVDFLRQPLSPRQNRAINDWRVFAERWILNEGGGAPSEDRMKELITIFDELFFAGHLGSIGFEWKKSNVLGCCRGPIKHGTHWSRIEMDPDKDHAKGLMQHSYETGLVNTLLHECIHAYLRIYSCGSTCDSRECQSTFRKQYGSDGHGIAFYRLASWIQALSRTWLDVSVDVDFLESITKHFLDLGTVPGEDELHDYHECHHDTLRRVSQTLQALGIPSIGNNRTYRLAELMAHFKQEETRWSSPLADTYSLLDEITQYRKQRRLDELTRVRALGQRGDPYGLFDF